MFGHPRERLVGAEEETKVDVRVEDVVAITCWSALIHTKKACLIHTRRER